MHKIALTTSLITKKNFNHIIQTWNEKFDGKLATMVFTINLNMDECMEAATGTLKGHPASIVMALGAMAIKFKLSNQCLQV